MASTYTYPGVYIQELTSPVHPITGVATSVGAFIGYTATGIDNRAELIFSFSDYQRLFGGLASNSELSYAVQQFFQNGGSQAYVVRTPALSLGAKGANVVFADLTFTALSSGTWADGQLLIDVDYNGVNQTADATAFNLTITNLVDGTVEPFPSVSLNSALINYIVNVVNDIDNGSQLVNVTVGSAAALPVQTGVIGTPIGIGAAANILAGSAGASIGDVTVTIGSANVTGAGFTSSLIGQSVTFACDASGASYQVSQVNSAGTSLTLTTPFALSSVTTTATESPGPTSFGTVTLTIGSETVTGAFPGGLTGKSVTFACDPVPVIYAIHAEPDAEHLTLTTAFTLTKVSTSATIVPTTTSAADSFGISITVTSPASLAPFPLDVSVFSMNTPIPQTVSGLAAQLQRALNSVLSVQMPGSSAQCSVSVVSGGQAIRINVLLPQSPDAVIAIGKPASATLSDASGALGLSSLPTANINVAHYALGTGNSGWASETSSAAGVDGTGLPQTADIIGDPSQFQGIYALDKVDAFNLMCIPDATRAIPGTPTALDTTVDPNAIFSAAIAYCDSRRAFLLIDCPPPVNTISAAIDWKTNGLTVQDPNGNGATFFPRLRLPDPKNNYNLRTYAPCGVVAGLYARTDTSRGVWKAPAGIEATLSGVQSLVYKMTDAENGVLNPLGLNCFRTFPVYGSVLWGARTIVGADADASQWKYVPVRRVALFLESSLYQGTQWVVFEPNDEPLWSAIRLNIGSFMQNLFIQGFFQGQTPDQAYFVKCDSETTTQTDIDNGVVNIVVGFAPLYPAEFVVIQIQQISGQTAN